MFGMNMNMNNNNNFGMNNMCNNGMNMANCNNNFINLLQNLYNQFKNQNNGYSMQLGIALGLNNNQPYNNYSAGICPNLSN